MYDLGEVLGPSVTRFVEQHVRSLLAWDILVYFHRNPKAVLDLETLSGRLGRHVDEVEPEVQVLCDSDILSCSSGVVCYVPSPELDTEVSDFVEACQDRGRRLALIALVLHRLSKSPAE